MFGAYSGVTTTAKHRVGLPLFRRDSAETVVRLGFGEKPPIIEGRFETAEPELAHHVRFRNEEVVVVDFLGNGFHRVVCVVSH